MKKRSPLAVLILSIVTFSIYDLFWLAATKRDMNKTTRTKVPTLWLLFLPILVLIGIVVLTMILAAAAGSTGSHTGVTIVSALMPLISMLAVLAILPISFYWFWKYSKAADEYTQGKVNAPVAFLLLWLLRFIGIAIIQDTFNDMLDGGMGQPAYVGAPQMPGAAPTVNPGMTPAAPQFSAQPQPYMPQNPSAMPAAAQSMSPNAPQDTQAAQATQTPTDQHQA